MAESNVAAFDPSRKAMSVATVNSPIKLVDIVLADLVRGKLIEQFEIDYDFELPPVSSNERILGDLTEDEKRTYAAYFILNEMLDEFMREAEASVLEKVGATLRDRSVQSQDLFTKISETGVAKEDQAWVAQVIHSLRLLSDVWSYSVKMRYNSWGLVGIRQTFVAVAIDMP